MHNSDAIKCMQHIDTLVEEGVALLSHLTCIDSTTGNEGEVQSILKQLMYQCGFDMVEAKEADKSAVVNHRDYIDSGFTSRNRPNIIGIKRGLQPENYRSLLILGHMDSVPIGDTNHWTKNPRGERIGQRFYARGAWDMKSGIVSSLLAIRAITDLGIQIKGNIKLCGSIEEECGGGLGALSVFVSGERADAVLVAEPEQMIAIACAGVCYFRITFAGKAAHGGRAHLGVNVIEKMNIVYSRLMELDKVRWSGLSFPLFEVITGRSCNINISSYHAGNGGSVVPDFGYMEGRASSVPGESMDDLKNEIIKCTQIHNDTWLAEHPPKVEWIGWQSQPWYQDIEHEFVKVVKRNADTILQTDVPYVGKACGLDARFCNTFNMPAVSIGSSGGNMHAADEYVDIPSIMKCAKLYASIIFDWCNQPKD